MTGRLFRTGGVVVLALALSACSNDAAPDAPSAPGASGVATATAPASPGAPAGSESASGPASCAALSLVEGTTIGGSDLGACMVDYLAFAGSGASSTTSETTSSRMVWRMADDYEAYAELDSGMRMTATGGRAWVDFGDGAWVEADPATPGMEVAFGIVQAWREMSAPELVRRMVASAPVWNVGPARDLELPDGTSRRLTGVTAASPFVWSGATVTAMTLWMDEPGRIILQETTAGAAGFTATSRTHATQWGGDVEIPDPASSGRAR